MNEIPGIINDLLATTLDRGASDLHIGAGHSPVIRMNGQLVRIEMPPVPETVIYEWLSKTMTPRALKDYEDDGDADFSFSWRGGERFRGRGKVQAGEFTGVHRDAVVGVLARPLLADVARREEAERQEAERLSAAQAATPTPATRNVSAMLRSVMPPYRNCHAGSVRAAKTAAAAATKSATSNDSSKSSSTSSTSTSSKHSGVGSSKRAKASAGASS